MDVHKDGEGEDDDDSDSTDSENGEIPDHNIDRIGRADWYDLKAIPLLLPIFLL